MIHHVTLECHPRDADAHRHFWTQLGFRPVGPPPSLADRAAWYERGGTQIHLLWTEDPVIPPDGHVAVRVDDLDALGVALEERTRHWGERRCYTHTPSGHLVEVFEVPPPDSGL
jgi:catechol 2,3-dioxygenase-like lactoylglutathione lyase family enzyme